MKEWNKQGKWWRKVRKGFIDFITQSNVTSFPPTFQLDHTHTHTWLTLTDYTYTCKVFLSLYLHTHANTPSTTSVSTLYTHMHLLTYLLTYTHTHTHTNTHTTHTNTHTHTLYSTTQESWGWRKVELSWPGGNGALTLRGAEVTSSKCGSLQRFLR